MTTANQAAKPLLAVKYPFVTEDGKEFSDLEKLLTDLGQQSGGYYLLGANNCWHGGIHITDEKFVHHKTTHPVRCMMDGVVIAYRLNKNYPIQKWQAKSTLPAVDLKFSNGFCLIKHEYESPANQTEGENKGKTNKLTFYSLYMHLADYNTYVSDSGNKEKTVTIIKDTNARDTANINHKLGELTSGSTVKVDTQQQPYKAKVNGKLHNYYRGTVVSKAADSTASIAVGALVYLYANCFPAGTFNASEKPKFPSYWKATVTGKSKQPMAVYSSEQTCKERKEKAIARLNPEQTVTFQSEQITYATVKGKSLKIALCEFPASSTFGSGPETNLKSGWMIVDESQVSWEKVEPTDFDHIVKLSKPLPISAGDPVGFMGIWESPEDPIAAGTTKTKYQMHVELFTANDKAGLDQFLNNDAKLTSGKKYLKVPKGTQLYTSNGHGNYVYVHDSLFAARDYIFAESDCTQVKDTAGTIFYQLKQIRTGEAALGPVDLYYVKIEGNVKLVTQYDWKELGFSTLEETNDDADGYINPEKIPSALFKDIFKRVDSINSRNGQGDGTLTGNEIKAALQQDKDLRNDLYKMIAGHPSEWHSATQNNIKKMYETIKAENTEEEYKNTTQFEIDRFHKCEFASQIDGLTQKLWHFHPIVSVDNLYTRGVKTLRCKKCNRDITITSEFMEKIAPNVVGGFYDDFSSNVNEIFNVYEVNTCYQVTHILAQAKIETKKFRSFEESLNYTRASYTAEKLYGLSTTIINNGFVRKGLGGYTREQKIKYIDDNLLQNDMAYAEHCYGNNDYPGRDYRGRGLLHLTHFSGYSDFKEHSGVDVLESPRLLLSNIKIAIQSGAWFWQKNNIGLLAVDDSSKSVRNITRIVNPAFHQLDEREKAKEDITKIFYEIYKGCEE